MMGFRACAASAGLFVLSVGAIGFSLVWLDRYLYLRAGYVDDFVYRFAWFLALLGLVAFWLFWLDRATWSAGAACAAPVIGPRCEGCGYDLTHLPEAGVCSECGGAIEPMLRPDGVRSGVRWQHRQQPESFLDATTALLMDRARFYRTVWVRPPLTAARRFALIQLSLMGALAGVWIFIMFVAMVPSGPEMALLLIPLAVSLLTPILGYCLLRLAAAMAFSWSALRRQLEDGAWSLPVVYYESTFLWVFCAANGAYATSFFVAQTNWVSQMFGGMHMGFLYGVPLELVFLVVYNLALIGWWVRRFLVNFADIRWNNF
jgi:hypothetical protein